MPAPIEISELVAFLQENPEASWNPLYDALEELAAETRQDPFTNSIEMEFVWIPPGRFLMGSPRTDREAYANEKPQHEVVLTRGFHIGKHPVTRGQFGKFARSTRHKSRDWITPGFDQWQTHPVVNVSWEEAVAFCAWLSKKENAAYRLPTEAEWEYACRAGTTSRRYFRGAHEWHAWFDDNSENMTHPVGGRTPNAWGLYDMLGHVNEYCFDYLSEKYSAGKCIDPQGPLEGLARVYRGGSWRSSVRECRSAFRIGYEPDRKWRDGGFRVVRSSG